MKTTIRLLTFILLISNKCFCQSALFGESITIVSIKYPTLSDILRNVLNDESGKKYYSDTLSFMMRYRDTIFSKDIILDSSPSYFVDSGTPVYTFVITPCPEGIPTLLDDLFYLLKYNNHYIYLIDYPEHRCDTILFSQPHDSVHRKMILETYPMEDDRWPDYFYYSTTDSNGLVIWRKKD